MSSTDQPDADGLILASDGGVPRHVSAIDRANSAEHGIATKSVLLSLGWMDRLLSLFIVTAMILGVVIGEFAHDAKKNLDRGQFEGVPAPLVIGLLVMIWPILAKVQFETLPTLFRTRRLWYQVAISVPINWILGPFVMLGLAWATLPDLPDYRAGIILVGIARCIAMVMIWNRIARGDGNTCAVVVIINSILQMVLYAPFALFFINVISGYTDFHLGYQETATAVGIYLGIPLGAGIATRFGARWLLGEYRFQNTLLPCLDILSLVALLFTIIVIFASQAHHILHNIGSVFRTIVPLVVYFAVMWTLVFAVVWGLSARYGKREWGYQMAVTQAFTAASNNFELAIAVSVATYGADAPQTLAATLGPLVEVPVLLILSYMALWIGARMRWDSARAHAPDDANNGKPVCEKIGSGDAKRDMGHECAHGT
ncbi:arsenicals resistance [Malassezia sp. CBS 17886]|nr:arsenicals resistance [Malassezia sp. CBS 17886]